MRIISLINIEYHKIRQNNCRHFYYYNLYIVIAYSQGLQRVPPQQHREAGAHEQVHNELPRKRRARAEEGTGAHRKGTYATVSLYAYLPIVETLS